MDRLAKSNIEDKDRGIGLTSGQSTSSIHYRVYLFSGNTSGLAVPCNREYEQVLKTTALALFVVLEVFYFQSHHTSKENFKITNTKTLRILKIRISCTSLKRNTRRGFILIFITRNQYLRVNVLLGHARVEKDDFLVTSQLEACRTNGDN